MDLKERILAYKVGKVISKDDLYKVSGGQKKESLTFTPGVTSPSQSVDVWFD